MGKLRDRLKPPPRAGIDPSKVTWPKDQVNAPEHNESTELDVSKAVGEVPSAAQTLAEAGTNGKDIEAEKERAKAEIEARKAQKAEVVLERVKAGKGSFSSSPKTATPECPYVHGKTLTALKKKELINFRKNEDGTYTIRLPHSPSSGTSPSSTSDSAPSSSGEPALDLPVTDQARVGAPSIVDFAPKRDDREVWLELVKITGGDTDKTKALFEQYRAFFG